MKSISEVILGTEAEQAAVKELKATPNTGNLAYEDQTRLEKAFDTWLRFRARQAMLILGTVTAISGTAYVFSKDSDPVNARGETVESKVSEQVKSAPKEISEAQIADAKNRVEEVKFWLKNLEDIVRKTQDPEAKAVLDFVGQNGVLGLPVSVENGQMGMQLLGTEENPKNWFAFIPLIKKDEDLTGEWRRYTNTNVGAGERGAVANFLPDMRAIVVKSNVPMSDIFKGIMFAHEAYHAKTFLTVPYNWQARHIFCEKERDAHIFQNRLMGKLGGEAYQAVLGDEVKRMDALLADDNQAVGDAHVTRAEYDPRLETVFGQSLSEYEQDSRETQLWIHANFLMIDRAFPNPLEAADKKTELYCSILNTSAK